jgi:hypothetical protein
MSFTQAEGSIKIINQNYNGINEQLYGNNIYLFKSHSNKEYYFRAKKDTRYVIMDKINIISLPNNEIINDETLQDLNKYFKITEPQKGFKQYEFLSNKKGIELEEFHENKYLKSAQHKVDELNEQIKSAKVYFKFDYKMNMTGEIAAYGMSDVTELLLCLYLTHEERCISTVELANFGDGSQFEINIETNTQFQKQNFNKLCLAAVIIILKELVEVKSIYFNAINPISAYLTLKYFNARVDEKHSNFFSYSQPLNYKVIEDYYNTRKETLKTIVILNDANVANAETVFLETALKLGKK